MPPFHVRCVRSLSLTYHDTSSSTSSASSHSMGSSSFRSHSPTVDLDASPELQGLHAVLLLGSSDTSDDERAIYDAFVKSRNRFEKEAKSDEATIQTKKTKCSTLLMCADGAVASKAAGSTGNTAVAFDAVCGDFDSIPPALLSLLVGDVTTPSGNPAAEFYHVTALYKKECHFVKDPRMRVQLPADYWETQTPDASATLSAALQRRQEALGQTNIRPKAYLQSPNSPSPPDSATSTVTVAPSLVVKVDCQMTTDFEKCCQLLEIHHIVSTRSQTPIMSDSEGGEELLLSVTSPLPKVLVLGALGGRLDHEFAVFNTLFQFVNRLDLLIFNGKNTIFAIKPNSVVSFTRDPSIDGSTVGVVVFGPPTNGIVSKGLKWELGPELVCGFGHVQSTSNKIVGIRIVSDDSMDDNHDADGGEGAEGGNCQPKDTQEAAPATLRDPLVAPLLNVNNGADKSITKEELRNTFIVDTRGVAMGTYVLVTVPREHKLKSVPPSPKL